jgi:PucR C-terminal helix-turn-helix domain/GGDEF-like domain
LPSRSRSSNRSTSQLQTRIDLYERLQARRPEIEQAVLARVYAVSNPAEVADSEYVEGLRFAVSAAIDYSFAGIEHGEKPSTPLPAALLTQARLAARNSINLDTVLRRYFAGYTLLGDFLMQEAEEGDSLGGAELKRLLRVQAIRFDRLVAGVTEEYTREAETRLDTAEQRRAKHIERLLAGDLFDASELTYDFDGHHLGLIAAGLKASEAIRKLASSLDCRLLLIHRGEGTVWAWFGARRPLDMEEFDSLVSQSWPAHASLAIGELGQGLAGWRLTHQQARAALPIAIRSPKSFIRYSDVALLASMLQDDLLATSLRELYLAPLESERDGGEMLRETLRAYFKADRNVSSAAAALGVSRQTVTNRLKAVEQRLGRSLNTCASEVYAALRLESLGSPFSLP